jgi:hypothetical protein
MRRVRGAYIPKRRESVPESRLASMRVTSALVPGPTRWISAMSCATKPPIEEPNTSTSVRPSASANAIIRRAVSAMLGPNSPVDSPSPRGLPVDRNVVVCPPAAMLV